MDASKARIFIVVASLALTGFLLTFLMAAPFLRVPFNENQNENVRLIEIVLPVFFGYLGSASHFLFNANRGREVAPEQMPLLRILVVGSFGIFTAFIICLFAIFWLSNGSPAAMSFDSLSRYFSLSMGLLACTISIIASYLFGAPPEREMAKGKS
jgi:hypothetical protein